MATRTEELDRLMAAFPGALRWDVDMLLARAEDTIERMVGYRDLATAADLVELRLAVRGRRLDVEPRAKPRSAA